LFRYHQRGRASKQNRKQEAITTAKRSMELAQKANNADYVALNEKLIAALQ